MNLSNLSPQTLAIIGVPHDTHSSFLRGAATAPPLIRQALTSGSANLCAENGFNLDQHPQLIDLGDLPIPNTAEGYHEIEDHIGRILDTGTKLLTLGGDHAIAYPIIKAHAERHEGLTVLQLDAHPDLYDELDGDRYSHACPFARLMETGLIKRLVQVGIRTLNPHQKAQAEKFGVEIIEMRHWRPETVLALEAPLYISLDLDVLDPAYAPGISHYEPGGMTNRDLLHLIQSIDTPLIGADIVEYNPTRDHHTMTAMVAAKLYKELAAKLIA